MGQIVGGAAKPKRCNLNKLSQLGTPAAWEHILVSSDNSMNAAGQGNFDYYIVGDGVTAATELELQYVDEVTDNDIFYIAGRYKDPVEVVTNSDYTNGSYIMSNNTTASNSNYKYVQNIAIGQYDKIIVYGLSQSAANTVLLDENLGIIRSLHISTSPTTLYPKEEGAAYISHCCQKAQNGSIFGVQKELIPVSETQNRLSALESSLGNKADASKIFGWKKSREIDISSLVLTNTYINSSGNKATASGFSCVYMLDISSYKRIRIWANVASNARNAIYGAQGNLIRAWTQSAFVDIDVEAEGAKYTSICWNKNYLQHGIDILEQTLDNKIEYSATEGYLDTTGCITTQYAGYSSIASQPFAVKEGDMFRIHGVCPAYGATAVVVAEDGTVVLTETSQKGRGSWATITIPTGGKYVIFGSSEPKYLDVYKVDTLEDMAKTNIIDAQGTWQALGTSITWYDKNPTLIGAREDFRQGYVSWLQKNIYFSNFTNSGVNGGNVSTAISVVANADYYTIEHGVNDCSGVPIGTIDDYINNTDNGTFAANYRKLIDAIYTANVNAKIIICTPLYTSKKTYDTFVQYVEMVKAIAHYEHLPVADFFYEANVNSRNIADMTIGDNLHPNDEGHKRMASVLLEAFRKVIPPNKLLNVETESSGE